MFKRVHLIVLDSVGIGEAPDAEKFADVGSDTLGHIARSGTNHSSFRKTWIGNYCSFNRCQSSGRPRWLCHQIRRNFCWKRYYDRSLGNYGLEHQKTFSGIPKRIS